MYLSMLDKNQKKLFLEMAIKLASSDQNFSDDEKTMIELYCREMEIDFTLPKVECNVDELIEKIVLETKEAEQKIFVFELIGLAIADGSYDDCEKEIISKMKNKFNLPNEFDLKCESIINEYLKFQESINQLVLD